MKSKKSASIGIKNPVAVYAKTEKRHPAFLPTKNLIVYAVLLFGALLFTQALRSTLSSILFVFLLMLLPAMLIYLLTARVFLSVYKPTDSATVEKHAPYTYELHIKNSSIIPYPFIDAFMILPLENMVRTNEQTVRLSLPPLGKYDIKNTIRFRFRGTYEIGVNCFYVYDLFRMFKMRISFGECDTIYVLPRRLELMNGEAQASADEADRTHRSSFSYDRIEISDIREYRQGDSLKSIHWKLSSKSDDFVVRDYDSGSTKSVMIFADMSARFNFRPAIEKAMRYDETDSADQNEAEKRVEAAFELSDPAFYEDMNEYCADGVCELTVAAVMKELRKGNECSLLWFDSRSEGGACGYTMQSLNDFSLVFKLFATSPLCTGENSLRKLSSMVKDTQNIKLLFVTSAIDPASVAEYSRMAELIDGISSGSAELIIYDPVERYLDSNEHKLYLESCRHELLNRGFKLTVGKLRIDI